MDGDGLLVISPGRHLKRSYEKTMLFFWEILAEKHWKPTTEFRLA